MKKLIEKYRWGKGYDPLICINLEKKRLSPQCHRLFMKSEVHYQNILKDMYYLTREPIPVSINDQIKYFLDYIFIFHLSYYQNT